MGCAFALREFPPAEIEFGPTALTDDPRMADPCARPAPRRRRESESGQSSPARASLLRLADRDGAVVARKAEAPRARDGRRLAQGLEEELEAKPEGRAVKRSSERSTQIRAPRMARKAPQDAAAFAFLLLFVHKSAGSTSGRRIRSVL